MRSLQVKLQRLVAAREDDMAVSVVEYWGRNGVRDLRIRSREGHRANGLSDTLRTVRHQGASVWNRG